MAKIERVGPEHVKKRMDSVDGALLVCAYDSEEKFRKNHLEGAISLDEFQQRVDSLSKDHEIVFYCA